MVRQLQHPRYIYTDKKKHEQKEKGDINQNLLKQERKKKKKKKQKQTKEKEQNKKRNSQKSIWYLPLERILCI